MDRFFAFQYFWLGGVALIGIVNIAWAINDLRTGSARLNLWRGGGRAVRYEEPFEFWLAVGGKLLTGLVVAPFMFWFGLGMLNA
jgi:hypothetical protein